MWSLGDLAPSSKTDGILRIVVAVVLLLWSATEGLPLEKPYPAGLIHLYAFPLTRLLLLLFVGLSAIWCPRVGIMAAVAYILLAADLNFFLR
jgi:hypothetical protein